MIEEIRRAIKDAEEVICGHALAREGGPALSLLVELGLVKPIRTGVPACAEHGCPYQGDCEHEETFATGAPGRAGRKARLSAEARAIVADRDRLLARVRALPLCQFVLEALAAGPCSLFALNTRLLTASLEEIDATGQVKATAFDRASLGRAIALLEELGEIHRLPDGATLARDAGKES
ncbi:MAG: hypothetical protein GX774_07185 [Armatimonadetes bacterium]|jgi:hypothetical protein|nr:hypothetical protein [Armatimonadota bacterium]